MLNSATVSALPASAVLSSFNFPSMPMPQDLSTFVPFFWQFLDEIVNDWSQHYSHYSHCHLVISIESLNRVFLISLTVNLVNMVVS